MVVISLLMFFFDTQSYYYLHFCVTFNGTKFAILFNLNLYFLFIIKFKQYEKTNNANFMYF